MKRFLNIVAAKCIRVGQRQMLMAALLMLATLTARAEGEKAYAVISADTKTLYFTYRDETLTKGGKFLPYGETDSVTITYVWSGTDVTKPSAPPKWSGAYNSVSKTYTTAVFEPSFAQVHPTQGRYWFQSCSNLTTIRGLEYLDTSQWPSFDNMFYGCKNLKDLDLSHLDTSSATTLASMFYECTSLTSLDLSSFDTSKVTAMNAMFYECEKLQSVNLSSFDTSKVTTMLAMFRSCYNLTELDLSHFSTDNVTTMGYMFYGCRSLTSLTLSPAFTATNLTTTRYMFYNCLALTSLDLSSFGASKVTNTEYMFYNCPKLASLDISHFDTSHVTATNNMFASCGSLTSLDVSSFDMSQVTAATSMFSNCYSLTTLDLSNFDTSKMKNTTHMFSGCTHLASIYVGESWTMEKVSYSTGMFSTCNSIVGEDGTTYNASYTSADKAHYNEGGYLRAKGWTVTIPASGISTFSADRTVAVPDGLDAYVCTTYDNDASAIATKSLNRYTSSRSLIPAATGVLLRGEAGETYKLIVTCRDGSLSDDYANALVAVTEPTHIEPTEGLLTNLMLKSGTFVRIAAAAETSKMPANKAYLQLPTATLVGEAPLRIGWDGEPTGISDKYKEQRTTSNEVVYDLQGRRVAPLHASRSALHDLPKGIYIIGGKKVIVK